MRTLVVLVALAAAASACVFLVLFLGSYFDVGTQLNWSLLVACASLAGSAVMLAAAAEALGFLEQTARHSREASDALAELLRRVPGADEE